jgi:hypothetical protein
LKATTEAKNILAKVEEFEFVLLLVIWDKILGRVNSTSQALQNSKITLDTCASLYFSLSAYVRQIQDEF